MFKHRLSVVVIIALATTLALWLKAFAADEKPAASTGARYFEMRKYHAAEGKLDALNARFRDHTIALFKKHGMDVIGFWVPSEGPEANKVLVYLLAYPSKEARDASWKAFSSDPDWKAAKSESEKDGKLVEKIDQTFMTPTDYSAIQ